MVRIAKVKFNNHSKEYDYLCENPKIAAGDVVYVEDSEQPVYVYDIQDVESSTTKASKKVLGIAEENPNVTIGNRYMNIINCNYTCIVNSLGPTTNVFGAICKAIVGNAKSKEIEYMLEKHPKANIFDTFITDSGNLPSKHIIHIVMPFKKDDHHNENLKKAFEKVIDLAIKEGYETVAIPFIGTGANGYEKSDVHEALDDTMFKYQYKKDIKINIISINYNSTKTQKYFPNKEIEEHYRQQRLTHEKEICESGRFADSEELYIPLITNKSRGMHKVNIEELLEMEEYQLDTCDEPTIQVGVVSRLIGALYNESDEFDLDMVFRPVDFLVEYRKDKGYFETDEVTHIFGDYDNDSSKKTNKYKDVIANIKKGKRKISKYETFRIAIALKLNFTQTIQFMMLSDYNFSPLSKDNIDYEVFNFMIHNDGFAKEDCDPKAYFSENCKQSINDILFGDENLIFVH